MECSGIGLLVLSLLISPGVSTTLESNDDGTLQLHVQKNALVNDLMEIRMYVEGEYPPLWYKELKDRQEQVTARLHVGGPKDGMRLIRAIEPGEEFVVQVEFQFDQWGGVFSGDQFFHFRMAHDGSIEFLGREDWSAR